MATVTAADSTQIVRGDPGVPRVTNAFSADYGRDRGVISIATSRTNALHGSEFEFFRNGKMDASSMSAASLRLRTTSV